LTKINKDTLHKVLTKMLGEPIVNADYQMKKLQGGTVGDVWLVTGTARALDERAFPYSLVLKIQGKWERFGDVHSWRREYDLYSSGLEAYFTESLRWPTCYHTEMNTQENEAQIWMEYIDGTTGLKLSEEMYEDAAYELGKFQGRLFAEKPSVLDQISNLSNLEFIQNYYERYKSWPVVYDYIRSDNCEIPMHLRKMLMDIDQKSDGLFEKIKGLPVVLCHRDFWVANIFSEDQKIRLIDWDTAGWGYMGEDISSLIADESDLKSMVSLYKRCVPAYAKGFSEHWDISGIKNLLVWERIILMFGYRIVEWYLDGESDAEKDYQLETLQKIYEMERV
jgi:thiamine kinase-like enzyme